MINTLFSIGLTSLANAQVSVNQASNNIANADTAGYRRTETIYETTSSLDTGILAVGTGATVSVEAQVNKFLEAQYLEASSQLSSLTYAYDYLSQAEGLLDQGDEDTSLNAVLSDFWLAWESLAADPTSESAREALSGTAELLAYEITSTADSLEDMQRTMEEEIRDQISQANGIITSIATLNVSIVSQSDNLELVNERDLLIRELALLVDVSVTYEADGQATVLTAGGSPLVQDGVANELVYSAPRVVTSLMRDSGYDGGLLFTGQSGEELLVEFVSAGADGAAQFKVSLDGGKTWESDEYGNTLLYTAGDSANPVVVEGVTLWFDGTGDHAVGDQYTVIAKTSVAWSSDGGESLINITPLMDGSTSQSDTRLTEGSIAGMLQTRDGTIGELRDSLDELAEALIWEVNLIHSRGAGQEHHTLLTGTCAAEDATAALAESGLAYGERIEAGDLSLVTYDADGDVLTQASVTLDPGTNSLDDLALAINTAFAGELTATVTADNTLEIQAATDMRFEVAGDETGILAALGLNTFFTGDGSDDIALSTTLAADLSRINCQVVEDDGTVSSGSNETAQALAGLASESVDVGRSSRTLAEHIALMVATVGTAVSATELAQAYAQGSVTFYEDRIASVSGVSVDEELVNLTKYQQMYEASAQIIATAQEMFETILDMT